MRIFVRILILVAIAGGIVYCLNALGGGGLTPKEAGLLSIVLTTLSILASWVVSDMYATDQLKTAIDEVQKAHRTNLRTYALKAAEKVTNLSSELNRLSTYLQQELDYTDYRSAEEELLAKEERLESAVHLIATLKSVNDTSLSDWQGVGVIDDVLEEQREEKNERERALLESLEEMLEEQAAQLHSNPQPPQDMRAEMELLRREVRLMASAVSGVDLPFRWSSMSRQFVELPCPTCGTSLKFRTSRSKTRVKAVRCAGCETRLVAKYDETRGYHLELRTPVDESFICPSCGALGVAPLDPVPSGTAATTCSNCGLAVTLVRTAGSIRVRHTSFPAPGSTLISDEVLDRVRAALPVQPWQTGMHKAIASDLDLSLSTVRHAIEQLIRRGEFYPQENGVVLNPSEAEKRSALLDAPPP
ncbi:MAG: hypothetical protein WAK26_16970 [Terracidiphilus sp.]